jgi:hypothetical protein
MLVLTAKTSFKDLICILEESELSLPSNHGSGMFGDGGSMGGMLEGIIPSNDELLNPEGFCPSI